jgi:UDP-N-acetylmuramate dehydrogenase
MRIGGAQISPKHANFIVNLGPSTGSGHRSGQGGARAVDVKALIDLVQEQVREQFGVELELEIELIGEWDG